MVARVQRATEGAEEREQPLRAAPALAVLAAWAALLDLALSRIGARVAAELLPIDDALALARAGALPRNVAAVCGLVALFVGLYRFMAMPGFAPLYVRLPIAAFAGVLTPTLTLATFLPRERTGPQIVVFGVISAQVLMVALAGNALPYRARAARAALTLVFTTTLLTITVLVLTIVRTLGESDTGAPIAIALRHVGELSWLLVGPAAMPMLMGSRAPRERVSIALGVGAMLALLAAAVLGDGALHPHYGTVLYGSLRLALLPEPATVLYVVPLAASLGVAVAGLTSADPVRRQIGAAVLLWTSAGYSGRSPIQVLVSVLAVLLLARAAQSLDPRGVERTKMRWSGWAGPSFGG